jgi:DNA-binding beta-propeller fold protein YncE
MNCFLFLKVLRVPMHNTFAITNTLSCHKINGDKLWEFKDVAIIRSPGGVAVDKDLNVYLASIYNNSVVVISPDGKRCRYIFFLNELFSFSQSSPSSTA